MTIMYRDLETLYFFYSRIMNNFFYSQSQIKLMWFRYHTLSGLLYYSTVTPPPPSPALGLASVLSACTLISFWNFVTCVRGLLSLCSLIMCTTMTLWGPWDLISTLAEQLGPWTTRPVADNSTHVYRTTRPVDTNILNVCPESRKYTQGL